MSNHSKGKELAKNTLIILVGKVCTQFLSFFLLPLYTAILDSSEFGIVDLATTYISLLVPCITLQLESAAFRFLVDARDDDEKKRRIISNIFMAVLILTSVCCLLYKGIGLIVPVPYNNYLMLIVIATVLSNITLQISRGLGDNISYSIGSLIAGGLTLFFNVIFLTVFHLGPKGMFLSLIIANTLCGIFVIYRCRILQFIDFNSTNKEESFELLRYSIPLVPNGIIWWIINASDRTIILIFLGTAANGVYAVAHKFSNAVMSAYYVFNMSWTESTSLYIQGGDVDKFISKTFISMLKIFSCLCLGIIGCMSFVFPIMVRGNNYADAYKYIPILMVGCVFNIIVGLIGAVYVALKKTKEIAETSFWSGMINIIVNLLLVKQIGLYAAAISTAVAFGIMAIYRYIHVQRYISLRISVKDGCLLIAAFLFALILYYSNNTIGNVINLVFVMSFSVFLNIDFLKAILSRLKKQS